MKGLRKGREAARLWATRAPGGVQQTIELEQLYEDEHRAARGRVALISAAGTGRRTRSHAGIRRDGVGLRAARPDRSWRPFEDRAEAMRAAGLEPRIRRGVPSRRWSRSPPRTGRPPKPGAGRSSTSSSSTATSPPAALGAHGEVAMEANPPRPGDRVLDIGCGFGDTTQRLAELVGPEGDGARGRRLRAVHRAGPPGGRGSRRRERRVRGRRRAGGGARRELRLRLLAHGHHVLRQPGGRAAQRPRGAVAGRPVLRRRLAAQARQRVGAPRRAGRRRVPRAPRGDRRTDLRPRALLDGQRRHRQRAAEDRRLRARSRCGAATCR